MTKNKHIMVKNVTLPPFLGAEFKTHDHICIVKQGSWLSIHNVCVCRVLVRAVCLATVKGGIVTTRFNLFEEFANVVMSYNSNWITLLLLYISAPLVLCCDRLNCGLRQVKRDLVDLVIEDYDLTLRWWIEFCLTSCTCSLCPVNHFSMKRNPVLQQSARIKTKINRITFCMIQLLELF